MARTHPLNPPSIAYILLHNKTLNANHPHKPPIQMPTYFNILRKSLREVLQAGDYRRKHQVGAGVHCQKQEADTLKTCLDEDELTMTIFAILIPTMMASIILYILVMRPLPHEKP